MLTFILNDKEEQNYKEFCKKHKNCEFTSTTGGKISIEFIPTGLGDVKIVKCKSCGVTKDITDIECW